MLLQCALSWCSEMICLSLVSTYCLINHGIQSLLMTLFLNVKVLGPINDCPWLSHKPQCSSHFSFPLLPLTWPKPQMPMPLNNPPHSLTSMTPKCVLIIHNVTIAASDWLDSEGHRFYLAGLSHALALVRLLGLLDSNSLMVLELALLLGDAASQGRQQRLARIIAKVNVTSLG